MSGSGWFTKSVLDVEGDWGGYVGEFYFSRMVRMSCVLRMRYSSLWYLILVFLYLLYRIVSLMVMSSGICFLLFLF